MKILVWSDLHCEFRPWSPPSEAIASADVIVLAGDIHTGDQGIAWASGLMAGKEVVYVAGNHEFYGGFWDETLSALRKAASIARIHFLENESVVIAGIRFLGCTLWSDFRYFGNGRPQEIAMHEYERHVVDCKAIRVASGRNLRAADVLARHQESRKWLEASLAHVHTGPTVVVTHHLPSPMSVAPRWRENRLTPGFVSDFPIEVLTRANVWIHGHTHDSCYYKLTRGTDERECLIVCNPRGYPVSRSSAQNVAFAPHLVVEVGDRGATAQRVV
jgi:predicted phosphodiesterase